MALSRAANDLVAMGEIDKGLKWSQRAYSINPGVCRYNVACTHLLAGKTERGLELLEEHARAGAVYRDWLQKDSDWDEVRDHPQFLAILELLGKKQGV